MTKKIHYQTFTSLQNNLPVLEIRIDSKFNIFSFVPAAILILVVGFFFYPICISENGISSIWPKILSGLFLGILFLLNLTGCLWMIYGKERIILKDASINHFRGLFRIKYKNKYFHAPEIKKWWINMELPDGLYMGKSDLMLLTRCIYPAFGNTYGSSFGLSGGKIFFEYRTNTFRMGNNLQQEEAEKIINIIKDYFNRKGEN